MRRPPASFSVYSHGSRTGRVCVPGRPHSSRSTGRGELVVGVRFVMVVSLSNVGVQLEGWCRVVGNARRCVVVDVGACVVPCLIARSIAIPVFTPSVFVVGWKLGVAAHGISVRSALRRVRAAGGNRRPDTTAWVHADPFDQCPERRRQSRPGRFAAPRAGDGHSEPQRESAEKTCVHPTCRRLLRNILASPGEESRAQASRSAPE